MSSTSLSLAAAVVVPVGMRPSPPLVVLVVVLAAIGHPFKVNPQVAVGPLKRSYSQL